MEKELHPPALYVHQLSVNYGDTSALWDISLDVPPGKMVGIIGPNGAGKSTFLKACLGLIPTVSGKVDFFGSRLTKVRERIAYVPQRESVDWDFPITVLGLVLMGCYGQLGLFKRPGQEETERALSMLEKVGMAQYADRQISQLSGGQQQRVFFARALMQKGDLYFLDEPFSGVDIATEQTLIKLLHELRDEGKTVFVVHHNLNSVEKTFDWLILLNLRLVGCGPTHELFQPQTLQATYGQSHSLFSEALKLSEEHSQGML